MSELWLKYLAVLWDTLGQGAARDLGSFKLLAERLWKPFITPVLDGTFAPGDFSRLLVSRRALFQDESTLVDSIISKTTGEKSKLTAKGTERLPPLMATRPDCNSYTYPAILLEVPPLRCLLGLIQPCPLRCHPFHEKHREASPEERWWNSCWPGHQKSEDCSSPAISVSVPA